MVTVMTMALSAVVCPAAGVLDPFPAHGLRRGSFFRVDVQVP